MNTIYILQDNLGFFCFPSVSQDTRTQNLKHARFFDDRESAEIFALVKEMKIYELKPVPI